MSYYSIKINNNNNNTRTRCYNVMNNAINIRLLFKIKTITLQISATHIGANNNKQLIAFLLIITGVKNKVKRAYNEKNQISYFYKSSIC